MKSTAVLGAASLAGAITVPEAIAGNKKKVSGVIPAGKPVPRFKNGEFRIMQLTDTHLKYEMPREYAKTFERIRKVVGLEHPDLIAVTGDNVTGEGSTRKAMWNKFTNLLDSFGIPYCIVYGNHDAEAGMVRSEMSSWVVSGRNDINSLGPDGELADVRIPVLGSDGKSKLNLYFMDSNDYSKFNGFDEKVPGYAWFSAEQIAWLREECKGATKANDGIPIPSLAFFHIPFPEYDTAWNEATFRNGVKGEGVSCAKVNPGMFAAMLESRSIMGVFVGHDHNSNYVADHYGIALGYGGFSGDDTTYCDLRHGLRIISVKEGQREFSCWIHDEEGVEYYRTDYKDGEYTKYKRNYPAQV